MIKTNHSTTTPTKSEIYEEGKRLFFQHEHRNGNRNTINPTTEELRESGFLSVAQSNLMSHPETIYGLAKTKTCKSDYKPTAKFTDFYDLLDYEECQASNILVSGTNRTGKSRLAYAIASVLQSLNWKVLAFDNSGTWKSISDIPNLLELQPNRAIYNLPITEKSLLVDISNLTLDSQKELIDSVSRDIWINRELYGSQWLLIVLEEFELYAGNLRGNATQNLKRICHAGRNRKVRVLGVTTDLSLIDCSFIRLCQQRFHARLGIEVNAKRRFRGYYGSEWLQIATRLQLGQFIYLNKDKLSLIRVPCFEAKRKPKSIKPISKESWFERWIYRSA